jgi:hypothetical protein
MIEPFMFQQPESVASTGSTEEFYTIINNHDYIDDQDNPRTKTLNNKTLAKKITRDDGTIRYTIKLSNNSKLYNPISIYGQEKQQNFLDKICRSSDRFKEVNLKTFELYLSFLKTRNISYLNNAERERS